MEINHCVSVIVPVYNMQTLVSRCIESILNQSYTKVQLILVDDGSTDKSSEICDKYAESDDRVTVIHKENGGVADATNMGLDCVTGDYVLFVDSDDYIEKNMIERLVKAQLVSNAEIVQTGMSRVNEKNIITEKNEQSPCIIAETDEIVTEFFSGSRILLCLASKLYNKTIFEGFRFETGRNIIDILATPFLLLKCNRYQIIDGAPYYAFFRSDSISRGFMTDKTYDDTFYYLDKWKEFLISFYPNNQELETRLYYRICYEMSTRYELLKNSPDITEKKEKLDRMRNTFKKSYKQLKRSRFFSTYPSRRRLMLSLFSINPFLMTLSSRINSRIKGQG